MCDLRIIRNGDQEILNYNIQPGCFQLWDAFTTWLVFHGVDPDVVPRFGVVQRDPGRRAIHVTETSGLVHHQGETPPMPFPDVIYREANVLPPTKEER